jgi:hypothetical protein
MWLIGNKEVIWNLSTYTTILLVETLLSVVFHRALLWVPCCLIYIYINDFPLLIRKYSRIILFADDTSILATSNNYAELNQNLNFLLQLTSKWFKINQLVLSTNKTYTVKFLSYKAPIYPLYLIDADQTLSVTDTIQFLGLHLDSHLSWKSHTNVLLVRKLSSVCYVMRKLSTILNIVTLRIVYIAYFQSLSNRASANPNLQPGIELYHNSGVLLSPSLDVYNKVCWVLFSEPNCWPPYYSPPLLSPISLPTNVEGWGSQLAPTNVPLHHIVRL